jgi:hypothetical protein
VKRNRVTVFCILSSYCLFACGSSKPDDEGAGDASAGFNHCHVEVTGDADSGLGMFVYDIDETIRFDPNADLNGGVNGMEAEMQSSLNCLATKESPVHQQLSYNVGVPGRLSAELPYAFDQSQGFTVLNMDFRYPDNQFFHCGGSAEEIANGKPAQGAFSFTVGSAIKRDDMGDSFMDAISASGTFACPAKDGGKTNAYGKGSVTIDVTITHM